MYWYCKKRTFNINFIILKMAKICVKTVARDMVDFG